MLTLLKIFAWIWGIAIVIVLVIDITNLYVNTRRGYRFNMKRYMLGTLKACCLAPLIYSYLLRKLFSSCGMITGWCRKFYEDVE